MEKQCCEKCLGSYGVGRDNWGCIEKSCECHVVKVKKEAFDNLKLEVKVKVNDDVDPQENKGWEERFDRLVDLEVCRDKDARDVRFGKYTPTKDFDGEEVSLRYFIREVEKEAEERGYQKALDQIKKLEWGADDFSKRFGEVITKMSKE